MVRKGKEPSYGDKGRKRKEEKGKKGKGRKRKGE